MKIKILFILILFHSTSTFACDICGCFMGITPYDNQSSFGILYRYRSYHGYNGQNQNIIPPNSSFLPLKLQNNFPPGSHNGLFSDYEVYRTIELRGKYFLHQKFELNLIVPFLNNTENYNNQSSTIGGLGDINIFAGYHLIRKLEEGKINQRLIGGLGVKLPSGNNEAKSEQGLIYVNPFQTGTGSTDGFIYLNYIIGIKNFGASINSSYKFNGQNNRQESIANSSTQFLNIFYKVDITKKLKMIPSIQTSYEFTNGEKYKGIETGVHQTNNVLTGFGLDIFVKNIGLSSSYQTNAWTIKTDHPRSSGRITLGLTYNLNQLYYAIN